MRAVRDKTIVRQSSKITSQLKDVQTSEGKSDETLILDKWNSKLIAKALGVPELEVELDRAVWQVKNALKGQEEFKEQREELDKATSGTPPRTQEQEKR
jgi:hypothetical protein